MAKKQTGDLRRWAVLGAEQRLRHISEEAARILRVFPELLGRGFAGKGGWGAHVPGFGEKSPRKRGRRKSRRRTMSAEGRKRISEAQKARWAKLKARKSSAGETAGSRRQRGKASRKKK